MDYAPSGPWTPDLTHDSDRHAFPQGVLPGLCGQVTQEISKAIACDTPTIAGAYPSAPRKNDHWHT